MKTTFNPGASPNPSQGGALETSPCGGRLEGALILACHNRPAYLAECLESLRRVKFPKKFLLLMIDDCSTDYEAMRLFESFEIDGLHIEKLRYQENVGIKEVLKYGFRYVFDNGADVAINLDADAVVKPEFIKRLLELKKLFPDNIVSGFNSANRDGNRLRNPIISRHDGYNVKRYANGINMCVSRANYLQYIAPALNAAGNWDFNASKQKPCIIAVPSLVQHIGLESSMGHSNDPDVAADYYGLQLPQVTLFGIDAYDPDGLKRAATICRRNVQFGDVKIITERLFSGREAYSKFCIKDMVRYVDTSHVLIIHPDGYIQNPAAWDDDWLQYDYIGARWQYHDGYAVGNGGFSLRSKRLLEIISELKLNNFHPEDCIISRQLRPMLEQQHGIRFAPVEVADKFSIEAYGDIMVDSNGVNANRYCGQFGFHGYYVQGLPEPPLRKEPPGVNKQQFKHQYKIR